MLHPLPILTLDDTAARSVRVALDTEHADRLAAAIKAGRTLPPVLALQHGDCVLVYDGAHRLEGYRRAFPLLLATLEIGVEITGEGGPADALALALGCNQEHGLPLSRADLRHRRELVLTAEEERVAGGTKRRSSRALAEVIGCSHTYVSEWYAEQGIELRRRKPAAPAPEAPRPGQQLLGGGEVLSDAALRDRLEARLTMAVHLGIEAFDLDGSDEDVGSWCSDLDEEPRERIEAALAGVERAIEARRLTQHRPPLEVSCPDPSPLDVSLVSPSAARALAAPLATAGDCGDSATAGAGPTCSVGLGPQSESFAPSSTRGSMAALAAPATGTMPTTPATSDPSTKTTGPTSTASPATTEAYAAVHRFALSDGGELSANEDEDAMLGEALDEARERIKALEAQVADLDLRMGIQHARADGWQRKAEIAQESADKLVSMQHRLDAAIGRERQAIARAERAEAGLTAAQRDAEEADAVSNLIARHIGHADGWPEGWTLDTMSRLPCWRAPRDSEGHRGPSAVVYEVAGGGYEAAMETPDHDTVEGALELLRRMAWGLAGRPLAASEPKPSAKERRAVWFVVHQRDGNPQVEPFIGQGAERAAKLTARFYAAQWTDVHVAEGQPVSSADFEDLAADERARAAKREAADLTAQAPAASFVESVMPYREPRWLAAVRGRLGAEPDEDVAWGAGPNVPTAAVRRERERLGISEYVAPAPPPDPFALYRPWTRSADELAAHLEALPREDWEQVRQAFGVASGARIIERLTLRIMRDARAA